MNRMLRMAESTGIGWRVWLGFFFAVFLLFFYVWIFWTYTLDVSLRRALALYTMSTTPAFLVFIIFNLLSSRKIQRLALLLGLIWIESCTWLISIFSMGNLALALRGVLGLMDSLSYVYAKPLPLGQISATYRFLDRHVGAAWYSSPGDNPGKLSNVIRWWPGYFWLENVLSKPYIMHIKTICRNCPRKVSYLQVEIYLVRLWMLSSGCIWSHVHWICS